MKKTILVLTALMIFFSCSLIWEDEPDDPVSCSSYLWREMKNYYPGLIGRQEDWVSVREKYTAVLKNDPTETMLKSVLIEITDMFNDEHISVCFDDGERYPELPDYLYSYDVAAKYISFKSTGHYYSYGNSGSTGYLYIGSFSSDDDMMEASQWAKDIGPVLKELAEYDTLIIDIRDNPGGSQFNAAHIAGFFLDRDYENAFTYIIKTGSGYDEYKTYYNDLEKQDWKFPKPVIVLMNTGSCSAADEFAAIFQHCTDAVFVGESNAVSVIGDPQPIELPNGWIYQTGRTGGSLFDGAYDEGDTFSVDYEIGSTREQIENGTDTQLEFALGLAGTK